MTKSQAARKGWKKAYRTIRIAQREWIKAYVDAMASGTGMVMIPRDGSDPYRINPRSVVQLA